METNNLETCKSIEFNGIKLCCFTNGNIYKIKNNGDMKHIKGNKLPTGYIQAHINYKQYYLHRIMGYTFLDLDITNIKIEIDHINRIKYDNRLDNLRVVTHQQNNWNKMLSKGYYWNNQRKKWEVTIRTSNNIRKYIGLFDNEIDAHNAYLKAKEEYHIF